VGSIHGIEVSLTVGRKLFFFFCWISGIIVLMTFISIVFGGTGLPYSQKLRVNW